MKTKYLCLTIAVLVIFSCAEKRKMAALPPPEDEVVLNNTDCNDTSGTIILINTKSVEQRVSISSKTSVRQGNTIVNNWKNFRTVVIPAGDSSMQVLKAGQQFMYTIYGPVSTNVNGLGVVGEEKFTLNPCEMRRAPI